MSIIAEVTEATNSHEETELTETQRRKHNKQFYVFSVRVSVSSVPSCESVLFVASVTCHARAHNPATPSAHRARGSAGRRRGTAWHARRIQRRAHRPARWPAIPSAAAAARATARG